MNEEGRMRVKRRKDEGRSKEGRKEGRTEEGMKEEGRWEEGRENQGRRKEKGGRKDLGAHLVRLPGLLFDLILQGFI